jgi:hypothetical protein
MAEENNSEEMNRLTAEGANIWKEILKESTTKKEMEDANIFIFGDKNTGKKSLIRIMNKDAGPQDFESKNFSSTEENLPLYGLMNYSHLNAKKVLDDETEINKIGVWLMNELIDKKTFLNLVKSKNMLKCVCLIIVDYSRPWNIIKSLGKWANFVYDSFGKMTNEFPYDLQTQFRKQSKKIFFNIKYFK